MIDDLTTADSVTTVTSEMIVPLGCGCSCTCQCLCPGETNLYSFANGAAQYRSQLVYDLAWAVIYG